MATGTDFDARCGVIKHGNQPVGRSMANLTCRFSGDVIDILTSRDHPIMAGCAASQNLGMIHPGSRHPQLRDMTGGTLPGCRNMRCTPTAGDHAIVTDSAGLGGSAVIKATHRPGCYHMTAIAPQGGRQVIGTFSGGNHAVMTAFTNTQHLLMIHRRNR